MTVLRRFGKFWWNFIVGDDWRLALTAGVALAITALLAARGVSVWWITPTAVIISLAATLVRARPSNGSPMN